MFKLRNRDISKHGHPTQFASRTLRDADTPLGSESDAPRVVADVTDIGQYFAGVETALRAPWYWERRQPPIRDSDWAAIQPQELDITGLWSLRTSLHPKAAEKVARGARKGDPLPHLVRYGDYTYVFDGHHRIADAIANGETTLEVRLVHLYQGDYIDSRDIVI